MGILQERLHTTNADGRRNTQVHADTANTALEMNRLKDTVESMMSELRNTDMEKKQLELRAEHEKQLIGLERKFQRQLMDARRKNEGLIDSLRQTYEDEVDGLKSHRADVMTRSKELEREIEQLRGQGEIMKQRVVASDNEQALQ